MQTITVRSQVGEDGVLHLEIPSAYPNTEVEATVTLSPVIRDSAVSNTDEWPEGFFERIVGGWKGEPLVREHAGSFEVREEL